MKYYFKPMLFFCLAIQVCAQTIHASSAEHSDCDGEDRPKTKTVPLHFSHTKSPAIREMGYCQLSIYDIKTKQLFSFPPLNIHTRSPNTSPRDKLIEIRKEKRSFGLPLPKPQPQTYEKNYDIPYAFLEPGNYLCLSFFIETVYLGLHISDYSMIPWQGLEDIALVELNPILKNKAGKRLVSFSLSIDWNKEAPSFDFDDFDLYQSILNDLRTATTLKFYYK